VTGRRAASGRKRSDSTGPACLIGSARFDTLSPLAAVATPIFLTPFIRAGYYVYALKIYYVSISYRHSTDALMVANNAQIIETC
jgi:hypothetical protein